MLIKWIVFCVYKMKKRERKFYWITHTHTHTLSPWFALFFLLFLMTCSFWKELRFVHLTLDSLIPGTPNFKCKRKEWQNNHFAKTRCQTPLKCEYSFLDSNLEFMANIFLKKLEPVFRIWFLSFGQSFCGRWWLAWG